MSNVVMLPVATRLDIPAERVLSSAQEAGLKGCVVIGETEDGEWYFASSYADGGDVLWHMARAQHKLMQIADGEND